MTGLGTLINGGSIIAGGIIGMFAGKLFKKEQQQSLCKVCGVSVLFIASLLQAQWRVCSRLRTVLSAADGACL